MELIENKAQKYTQLFNLGRSPPPILGETLYYFHILRLFVDAIRNISQINYKTESNYQGKEESLRIKNTNKDAISTTECWLFNVSNIDQIIIL